MNAAIGKMMPKPKIIVLTGTTALGKSYIASKMAHLLNGELISADSVKVYKNLDVGSNKKALLSNATHFNVPLHLCNILDPGEQFNVGDFVNRTQLIVDDILKRNKVPIIVGGSAMYIDTFLSCQTKSDHNLTPMKNPEIYEKLKEMTKDETWEQSLERLREVDPVTATKLGKNDYFRLLRALEIYHTTGQSKSQLESLSNSTIQEESPYDIRAFVFNVPRIELYRSIDTRCEEMVKGGLLEETFENFYNKPAKEYDNIAIGYKSCLNLINMENEHIDQQAFQKFLFEFQTRTRNLGKRQLSWYRNSKVVDYFWINTKNVKVDSKSKQIQTQNSETEGLLDKLMELVLLDECEYKLIVKKSDSECVMGGTSKAEQLELRTYVANNRFYSADKQGIKRIMEEINKIYQLKETYKKNEGNMNMNNQEKETLQ
jgi:tRNA dimethylallyltransferase